MERLTGRSEKGTYIIGSNLIGVPISVRRVLERLVAYEDTGLTPEEIEENALLWRMRRFHYREL